jgi:hypothetical protein
MSELGKFEKRINLNLSSSQDATYAPEINDLFYLYTQAREKAVVSILEFGSGWSTLALAMALHENYLDFGLEHLKEIRHPNPFQLMTLDASEKWQGIALNRLSELELSLVTPKVVVPLLSEVDGVLCHYNDFLPNFTPDMIYLDGPDHDQVRGEISGFQYDERFTPPMSGDLLRMEPFLWPETILIADGRTANVRFLYSHFNRDWQILHDPFGDRSILRINETALGVISEQHINFRLQKSRIYQQKENPER